MKVGKGQIVMQKKRYKIRKRIQSLKLKLKDGEMLEEIGERIKEYETKLKSLEYIKDEYSIQKPIKEKTVKKAVLEEKPTKKPDVEKSWLQYMQEQARASKIYNESRKRRKVSHCTGFCDNVKLCMSNKSEGLKERIKHNSPFCDVCKAHFAQYAHDSDLICPCCSSRMTIHTRYIRNKNKKKGVKKW